MRPKTAFPLIVGLILVLVLAAIVFVAILMRPATPNGGQLACTAEAKLCPAGSYVGRNSANGCAFDPCP